MRENNASLPIHRHRNGNDHNSCNLYAPVYVGDDGVRRFAGATFHERRKNGRSTFRRATIASESPEFGKWDRVMVGPTVLERLSRTIGNRLMFVFSKYRNERANSSSNTRKCSNLTHPSTTRMYRKHETPAAVIYYTRAFILMRGRLDTK